MIIRITSSIVVLASILFLPYWIYLSLLFLALVLLPMYWEGILLGFLADIFYGSATAPFHILIAPIAILSLVIILLSLPIRENIRSYA